LKTKQVRPQRRLLGGESAVEEDRISPLESHRQPLEQARCFPGVFSDGCHSSAQLLHQFQCSVFPGPAVSMATGTKMWLLASCLYLASLLEAAFSAAAPAVVAVSACQYYYYC